MAVTPVPPGFHTATPHLVIKGASEAISFYQKAFGAEERIRNAVPGSDKILHAQIAIGDSTIILADEFPDWNSFGPAEDRSSPVTIHLYVEDADAAFERAVKAGAEVVMPLGDQFWGDRYGVVVDPFGHRWSIASRVEELSPAEMGERAKQAFGG